MATFIVTAEFTEIDDIAFEVEAETAEQAIDRVLERSDATGAHAQTIAQFEDSWGEWTRGMFEAI